MSDDSTLMNGTKNSMNISFSKLMAPAALIILYIFFGFFGRNFFSYSSLVNIVDASYYIGFISIGVTFVIITGGIDLSVGTVMMCGAIIGGTAYKTWNWPIGLCLVIIVVVCVGFGFFNGLLVSRLKMPPFIVTLGTMMISMGIGSIVSNVQSATFPTRAVADGWFKNIFKIISEDGVSIPTGAFLLIAVAVIAHVILSKTKMGRYTYAIGSNKEAARLSGVNVKRWEMMAYVVAGSCAGIGGISYAAIYTTVIPAQGQGFELYAIAGAVIGGTSLAGGVGTILGTVIGVFIMSVLSVGLPAMDLQAHYQTFFTGVVVVGAVLLDMYRNRRAAEVRLLSPADEYRAKTLSEIQKLREEMASLYASDEREKAKATGEKANALRKEMGKTYRAMKAEEKTQKAHVKAQEREAERELQNIVKQKGKKEAAEKES